MGGHANSRQASSRVSPGVGRRLLLELSDLQAGPAARRRARLSYADRQRPRHGLSLHAHVWDERGEQTAPRIQELRRRYDRSDRRRPFQLELGGDRKSTRLNSSHRCISYAVFCLKKKKYKKDLSCSITECYFEMILTSSA